MPLLNPHPQVSVVPIFDGHQCVVIDDFMLEPEVLVDFAASNQAFFAKQPGNYYPARNCRWAVPWRRAFTTASSCMPAYRSRCGGSSAC
jgi:hypothetical protein